MNSISEILSVIFPIIRPVGIKDIPNIPFGLLWIVMIFRRAKY